MYFACRVYVAIAFVCGSMFLLAGTAQSQIQFNPNVNVYGSPAEAPCKAAISAKIQTEHDAPAHFEAQSTVEKDTAGNTRVRGHGNYPLGTAFRSFAFDCVYDEHNKAITSASYEDYAVNSERLLPLESQAQDCQEKTIAGINARGGREAWTKPKSIVSKTNKNGDRIIYGDGVAKKNELAMKHEFKFHCTYRDGRLITVDYWYLLDDFAQPR